MNPEQRDQIVQIIEQALAEGSGTTASDVYGFFENAEPWVRSAADLLGQIKSRESLIELLEQLPAEYEQHIPLALVVIAHLPSLAVKDARQILQPAAKALAVGTAGRPQAIPDEIKPEIVRYIGKLFVDGVPIGTAQQRAAAHFGLRLRSVERVWRDRKLFVQNQPESIRALLDILAARAD